MTETTGTAPERALLPNRTRCAICGLRIMRGNLIRHLDSHDREARRLLRTRARLVDRVNRIDAALASLGVADRNERELRWASTTLYR